MIKKKKKLIAEEMPEFFSDIESMPVEDKIFVDKSVEIVDYIHQLIEEKGLKQKDLALKMGKTEAELSKILSGMHNLTLRSIAKLEAALEEAIVCVPVNNQGDKRKPTENLKDIIVKIPDRNLKKMKYPDNCRVINMDQKKEDNNGNEGTTLPEAI